MNLFQFAGYYRVNYDSANWDLIGNLLKYNFTEFSAITRSAIIDDAFKLAQYGYINYSRLFDLVNNWKTEENEYISWKIVLDNFEFIYQHSSDLTSFKKVKVKTPLKVIHNFCILTLILSFSRNT